MELSETAKALLSTRYLLKNERGEVVETVDGMFERVARHVAKAEGLYGEDEDAFTERFFELMRSLRFLPNSPTLMNAGRRKAQLAACFVLPVSDSMDSIFETLKQAALILQSGGGTGFSFSKLRPNADIVGSTGGVASGPVSFMKVYNTATEVIKQGGARRGANMGMLRVDHPDIIEFVRIKKKEGGLENFNLSVAVTDRFMQAVEKDWDFPLVNPRTGAEVRRLKARFIFDEIACAAWKTGDPGLVFIDRVNESNPTPHLGEIECMNPCGEQPLLPYEACVLGSMNLTQYVKGNSIDFDSLERDVELAVRFLDDTIDVNEYPVPEIERMHKGNRKIGLGIMGWADTLIQLGIPYNSTKAFGLARRLMATINTASKKASSMLAEKRGEFPNFKGSIYDRPGMPKVRNATTTTIAPTGSISIIAGCSSGIEPLFAIAYKRKILDREFLEVNRLFVQVAKERGFYSEELMERVEREGTIARLKEIPKDVRRLFVCAFEIAPRHHIEMQASFQAFTDNAVSKTVNLKETTGRKEVASIFFYAWRKRLKGITVFRYTSRRGTLLRIYDD